MTSTRDMTPQAQAGGPRVRETIPPLLLERLAAGALSEAERAALEAEFGEELERALVALRADNAEILAELPPPVFAAQVAARVDAVAARRARAEAQQAAPVWRGLGLMALGACAAAAVFALRPVERPAQVVAPASELGAVSGVGAEHNAVADPMFGVTTHAPGTIRLKGAHDPAIQLWKRGERAVLLQDGAAVRAGDTVQLSYRAGRASHGVIVSIDGAGQATLHFPAEEGGATTLQQDRVVPLEYGYTLDDAPRFERFYFITGDAPLDAGRIMRAAERVAREQAKATRRPGREAAPLNALIQREKLTMTTLQLNKVPR